MSIYQNKMHWLSPWWFSLSLFSSQSLSLFPELDISLISNMANYLCDLCDKHRNSISFILKWEYFRRFLLIKAIIGYCVCECVMMMIVKFHSSIRSYTKYLNFIHTPIPKHFALSISFIAHVQYIYIHIFTVMKKSLTLSSQKVHILQMK